MFSGIIEKLARVTAIERSGGSLILDIGTGYGDLDLGESVAVNGVCLTVTTFSPDGAARFFVSPETLERSNLGGLQAQSLVNLERSVRLETRLSGHLVQGHVDGMAVLRAVTPETGSRRLVFELSDQLARFCVEKGSIALNGISLTINGVEAVGEGRSRVAITIIPHTWEHTNLHAVGIGQSVNVEVDVIAKYVERLCQPYRKP
ncbi:MAG TPA: riboflavin synthase [Devosia sp.]|jgi:riboflavin synthase|nr:riboflavin synthase [Devosia sp.]